MKDILVTGGNGQVGSDLQVVAKNQSTFYYNNESVTSWYDFAQAIF